MSKVDIDLTDRKILAELDKNCRMPNSAIAKKVHKSREAVKYRISQLQKNGILTGFITSINPNKLGFYMFKVYLKLENITNEREMFFEELKKNKDIYWYGISDGVFDCVFAILSRSVTEYYGKINILLSRWDHLIVSKVLGTMVDATEYNKKFFDDGNDANGAGPQLPSEEAVIKGTYQPLSRPLFIYVNVKSLQRGIVKKFVQYYIANSTSLAHEVGIVPLSEDIISLVNARLVKGTTGSIFGGKGSQVGVHLVDLLK